ncbi:hypothetical protein M426DRAFT_268916 [Hypoxylon sp. CI-4A]|nr:hypothetical protein M426DRAFT_268916 [Hypoxylon sp. CI-4A]
MAIFTDLPPEIVSAILRNLDDLRYLAPALLSCRHVYNSYKEFPHIDATVLCSQVTMALVPYAVAVAEASNLPRPRLENSVCKLLDKLYSDPAKLTEYLWKMPPNVLRAMVETHEAVLYFANSFAANAWDQISPENSSTTKLVLSPQEHFRFYRSFYQIELFYRLFRGPDPIANGIFRKGMNSWFFWRLPPWVIEQMFSAYEFFQQTFARASQDVVAHDIDFGEYSIDYLDNTANNGHRHRWLSQGIEFTYELINTDCWDDKCDLLKSIYGSDNVNILDAFYDILDDTDIDAIEQISLEEDSLIQTFPLDTEDTDRGPLRAWSVVHKDVPRMMLFTDNNDAWLHDRAYVFWDWDRLQQHNLLELFGGPMMYSKTYPNKEALDEMFDSFQKRSEIWQKGGSGYWSKDDTSRIVYPRKKQPV